MPNSFLKLTQIRPLAMKVLGKGFIAPIIIPLFFIVLSFDVLAQVLPNTAANRSRGVAGCTQTSSGITCPGRGGGVAVVAITQIR